LKERGGGVGGGCLEEIGGRQQGIDWALQKLLPDGGVFHYDLSMCCELLFVVDILVIQISYGMLLDSPN
jgi:hypothetical protein